MASIDLHEANLKCLDRIETVLKGSLKATLDARSTADYDLLPPEAYIKSTVHQNEDVIRGFQETGAERVLCWISREGVSTAGDGLITDKMTGDGRKFEMSLESTYSVTFIAKMPALFKGDPEQNINHYWERITDKYAHSATDVLMKNIVDGEVVSMFLPQEIGGFAVDTDQLGPIGVGGLSFNVVQDILVFSPNRS